MPAPRRRPAHDPRVVASGTPSPTPGPTPGTDPPAGHRGRGGLRLGAAALLLVAALALVSVPRSARTPSRALPLPAVPAVSTDVALAVADAARRDGLNRWPDGATVTVAVSGRATAADVDTLGRTFAELAGPTGLRFAFVGSSTADYVVHFVPRSRWPDTGLDGQPDGVTSRLYSNGVLSSAASYIDPDLPQSHRDPVIAHEVVHATGPGHVGCASSLMHEQIPNRPPLPLSAFDAELVAAWYAMPTPTPGHVEATTRRALEVLAARATPAAPFCSAR